MKPPRAHLSILAIPIVTVAIVTALALVAVIAAQEGDGAADPASDPAADGIFVESIDVNVVNVEVYVTDKKGDRVTGLGRDDFELFEDDKPVKISNFYAVEDGVPVSEAAPAAR